MVWPRSGLQLALGCPGGLVCNTLGLFLPRDNLMVGVDSMGPRVQSKREPKNENLRTFGALSFLFRSSTYTDCTAKAIRPVREDSPKISVYLRANCFPETAIISPVG